MSLETRLKAAFERVAATIKQRGMPAGGAAGQVLTKAGAGDYAVGWTTPAGGGSGGLAAVSHDSTLSGDGTVASPLSVVGSTSGTGATPRLSAPMPAIQRSPRLTQSVGVASGVYRQFTPNADITITGLRDTAPHNTTVRAVIWNANTQAQVAISPVVTAPSTAQPYSVMFASPVALTAGVPYMIGMYSGSGQLRASDLIENLAYAGFTVDHQTHYDPYRSNYPNSTIATVDKWGPTFDLLQPATAQKGVIGPLDMVDMPTVAAIADLPASSWAVLDDGVSAPRPVRRRADGSVWYGAAFTNTP